MKEDRPKAKKNSSGIQEESLEIITKDACGIDIGSKEHWVAVPKDRDEQPIRKFGCFTADLHAMAHWLKKCNIKTIAMESTGIYWIPVFQILEEHGFGVKLVNAAHVKNVPGRKTDILDCQWLQQLHSYGLLSGSFRPEDQMCVLRSYWRHRENLVCCAAAHIQHMQKALDQMNIHIHKVISDITGVTGICIIKAILSGERDLVKLANMKDSRIKSDVDTIVKSLQGDYRQEHLFALQQSLELYEFYQQQIEKCDKEIESFLKKMDSRIDLSAKPIPPPTKGKKKFEKNTPKFDLRTHLYRITGVDFTQIAGLNTMTIQTIISEIGLDPSAFPSEKHFASWLGLCPNHRITGGNIKSRKTRKVVNRATNAFRMAAQSLANSKSSLGGFYRRIRSRLGSVKANVATAHKLARIFYRFWKNGGIYQDPGHNYYEEKYKERLLNNLKKKFHQLGFEVSLTPISTT